MNKNKGYTLVELAIVITIMGILMTITAKGKQIIENANWKSDISKIRKISIAIVTIREDTGDNLPLLTSAGSIGTHLDYKKLIEQGYIQEKWFRVKSFTYAEDISYENTVPFTTNRLPITILHGCIETSPNTPFRQLIGKGDVCSEIRNGTVGSVGETISAYQVCMLEKALDNNNSNTGNGRTVVQNTPQVRTYEYCEDNNKVPVNSYGWVYRYEY